MYIRMFINMGVFRVYQGASNHEELHNLLKATVMTRRLKKVVLSQLPAKCRQQVFLDLELGTSFFLVDPQVFLDLADN
ncbi:hypothetical protein AAHE18_11G180700 [Arachis hypogaea]